MRQSEPAELLRVYISESDRYQGKPLHEAIVAKCRELKIAGASVFAGREGYGETAELHRPHVVHRDCPIVVMVIDRADKIRALVPEIERMLDTGLIATSAVQMLRVEKAV